MMCYIWQTQGFDQISFEPVVSLPDEPYAIREEDIPVLLEQYDILAKEMIKRHKEGRGFNFFHFMIDLTGGTMRGQTSVGVWFRYRISVCYAMGETFIHAISLLVKKVFALAM